PYYDKVTIKLHGGPFTVIAHNQGPQNCYVISAKLNGKDLDRCYLKMSEFQPEAVLELEMSDTPNDWATGTRPPSFIS
ncbi:MAG: glycoside hydrolase domain-containing protein, partial [Verrucomicrobiota bacterium]